jgi:hypothetical protein
VSAAAFLARHPIGPWALLLIAAACDDVTRLAPQHTSDRLGVWVPEPGSTVLHTDQSKLGNPTLAIVSDPATWRALWTAAWGGMHAAPALPPVDFVLASVVVVGMGTRAGLGYAVTIDSIVAHTVGAVLYATETLPGAHCDISTSASAPVHMVHAPGHPPVVEWRVAPIRRDCAR